MVISGWPHALTTVWLLSGGSHYTFLGLQILWRRRVVMEPSPPILAALSPVVFLAPAHAFYRWSLIKFSNYPI